MFFRGVGPSPYELENLSIAFAARTHEVRAVVTFPKSRHARSSIPEAPDAWKLNSREFVSMTAGETRETTRETEGGFVSSAEI